MKKITLATVKSFIKNSLGDLHIQTLSRFDGMDDCVRQTNNPSFIQADISKFNPADESQMGIPGVWFVRDSRDYFNVVNTPMWTGFEVSNCCGNWQIVVPANTQAAARLRVRLGL